MNSSQQKLQYKRRGGSVEEDKVFQGLQKRQKCKLCEMEFYVDDLPGSISYNSVLKLREQWGVEVHYPKAPLRYQKVKLCVFCSQFCEHKLSKSSKK